MQAHLYWGLGGDPRSGALLAWIDRGRWRDGASEYEILVTTRDRRRLGVFARASNKRQKRPGGTDGQCFVLVTS